MAGYSKVKEAAKGKKKKKKKEKEWTVEDEVGVDLPEDKPPKKREEKPEKYSKIRQHLNKISKAWTAEDDIVRDIFGKEIKGTKVKPKKKKKIIIYNRHKDYK